MLGGFPEGPVKPKSPMSNFIQTAAFILIIIGLAGLLLREFFREHSTTRTIAFAAVELAGLANLAFARSGIKHKSQSVICP